MHSTFSNVYFWAFVALQQLQQRHQKQGKREETRGRHRAGLEQTKWGSQGSNKGATQSRLRLHESVQINTPNKASKQKKKKLNSNCKMFMQTMTKKKKWLNLPQDEEGRKPRPQIGNAFAPGWHVAQLGGAWRGNREGIEREYQTGGEVYQVMLSCLGQTLFWSVSVELLSWRSMRDAW